MIAPLDALAIPIAAVSGWLIWRDVPTAHELAGAALILGATWYVSTIGQGQARPTSTLHPAPRA